MNYELAAKAIVQGGLPLDSVAQYRNVWVKLFLLLIPMIVFVLVMVVRDSQSDLYMGWRRIVLCITFLGTCSILDFRSQYVMRTLFRAVVWFLFGFVCIVYGPRISTLGLNVMQWLGGLGLSLSRLPMVEGRVWLVVFLVSVLVPAAVRLLSLRDIRTISTYVPSTAGQRMLEVSSVVFFLIVNTFGRHLKSAWDNAMEKSLANNHRRSQALAAATFIQTFLLGLLKKSSHTVLLAFSLVNERGFRNDHAALYRWSSASIGPEDVAAIILILLLFVSVALLK